MPTTRAPLLLPTLLLAGLAAPLLADPVRPGRVVAGEPSTDGEQVLVVAYHVHSVANGWRYPPGEAERASEKIRLEKIAGIARQMKRLGVDAVVFTEHNSLAHRELLAGWRRDPERDPLILWGIEYSATRSGHVGLVYPQEPREAARAIVPHDPARTGARELEEAIRAIQAAGGLAVVHHPLTLVFPWPSRTLLGARALEIASPAPSLPGANQAFWQARLAAGERIVGLAGMDYHPVPLATPGLFKGYLNLVRLEPGQPADARSVYSAISRGHVQVARPLPWQRISSVPRLILGADADGDGRHSDAREGDLLVVAPGQEVAIQVRVEGASRGEIEIWDETSRRPAQVVLVTPERRAFGFVKRMGDRDGFVRAVYRTDLGRQVLVSNPIYLRPRRG